MLINEDTVLDLSLSVIGAIPFFVLLPAAQVPIQINPGLVILQSVLLLLSTYDSRHYTVESYLCTIFTIIVLTYAFVFINLDRNYKGFANEHNRLF